MNLKERVHEWGRGIADRRIVVVVFAVLGLGILFGAIAVYVVLGSFRGPLSSSSSE
jgi:hypothetical protein